MNQEEIINNGDRLYIMADKDEDINFMAFHEESIYEDSDMTFYLMDSPIGGICFYYLYKNDNFYFTLDDEYHKTNNIVYDNIDILIDSIFSKIKNNLDESYKFLNKNENHKNLYNELEEFLEI